MATGAVGIRACRVAARRPDSCAAGRGAKPDKHQVKPGRVGSDFKFLGQAADQQPEPDILGGDVFPVSFHLLFQYRRLF